MKKKPSRKSAPSVERKTDRPAPTIVGIGASAGGLDAFIQLLQNLPDDTGFAYVIVQHLSPDHESLLPDLLAKASRIPVVPARDNLPIEADHVYVIPPDVTMTVTDGHLKLVRRARTKGPHFPIDAFLASLAEVHGASTIVVILSGAGHDGARGLSAVKEAGGITFAQDSASAKHASMPNAAFATGAVDFTLAPDEIAREISKISRHLAQSADDSLAEQGVVPERSQLEDAGVAGILNLILRKTGVDFAYYRKATVERRILRRMLVNRVDKYSDYLEVLRRDPAELDVVYQDLLIGVTSFFRDPAIFAELRAVVFPALFESRKDDEPIRVWVAGCSGGEESYSIAIALIEYMQETGLEAPVQIFGTDLSEHAVARARAGRYPESISEQVSRERLSKFFVPDRSGYRIAKFVRELCIFSRQNITRDPPFSRIDLISCRNVLIYFEPALQRKVFSTFHYALKPHGVLVLGTAESPGPASELFHPISKRHRIYSRRPRTADLREFDFISYSAGDGADRTSPAGNSPAPVQDRQYEDLQLAMDQALVDHFGKSGVTVDEDMQITSFRGDTTPFLAHAEGSASLDILKLARREIAMTLRTALTRAKNEKKPASERYVVSSRTRDRHITIDILPINGANGSGGSYFVLFNDRTVKRPARKAARGRKTGNASDIAQTETQELEELRDELAASRAFLTSIIEEHEASLEELRAAGEEIQSSNEELQSTNEELETTKEEVQSTNEELSTVNEELRHRNRELTEIAGDLANIFASTTIPILIVGRDLRLRRFTPATSQVMKVVPTDVGRPLNDVKLSFHLPALDSLITDSIDTLAVSRHLIKHTEDDSMWALTIRPYQTVDRVVDGAVLVFADGSEASLERALALEASERARVRALQDKESLSRAIATRDASEAERNALQLRLQSAQEKERRHLARELHDELGQHLTALSLGLHELSKAVPPGSEVDRRTQELRSIVETVGREIHDVALRLRPKSLDDFGLELTLASYAEEWSRRHGIAVESHIAASTDRLPLLVESEAFRVAQEALNNVAKHSSATGVSLIVERRDGELRIIVEDNGRSFDERAVSSSVRSHGGLGLLGIRERVALLNGTVELETSSAHGTTLYVRIPIVVSDDDDSGIGE
jgi:two-component system CheB/CheR fusion protein